MWSFHDDLESWVEKLRSGHRPTEYRDQIALFKSLNAKELKRIADGQKELMDKLFAKKIAQISTIYQSYTDWTILDKMVGAKRVISR